MKISVVGGGSWGVTLANILACNSHEVMIYERDMVKCQIINNQHANPNFLDYKIDEKILASTDMEKSIDFANVIVLAVPSGAIRSVVGQINKIAKEPKLFVNVAKGIEPETLYTISQVYYDSVDKKIDGGFVTLSGPSLAKEVMRKRITLLTAASKREEDALLVQQLFSNQEYIRVYTSTDLVGVEVGGSVKNAIALISGILDGLNLGENARAALICRGLEELAKINRAFGGQDKTLFGLSGIGDLIVTSVSEKSRNFKAGRQVATGLNINDIMADSKEVIEGPRTIISCHQIGLKYEIELPIIETAYQVLFEDLNPLEAINNLMKRTLKSE